MPEPQDRAATGADRWSDDQTRQHLQVLVESVAVLAGFEHSAVSLRRGDEFEVVVAAGVEDGFVGTRMPAAAFERELDSADVWGAWRFVPHDRADADALTYSHIPDVAPLDGPDAWHPLNLLCAPLCDDEGHLRGVLSVDCPRDGRLPGPEQRAVLDQYADVARALVLLTLEREELATRVRLATEARTIVRRALGEPTLDLVVEACRSTVVSCFDAVGLWLTAYDDAGGTSTAWYAEGDDPEQPLFSEFDDVVIRLSHRYWADQYVAPFSREQAEQPGLEREDAERLLDFLDRIGIGSVLFVPLGAGPTCLGFLVLTRLPGAEPWTDVEREAALDIGRDLGRAVANARQLERERAVADRLRRLDGYRLELVNTLGHELRTPLFSMTANLEMLDVDSLGPDDQHAVAAARRGAARMHSVIEDLLTMAQVADSLDDFEPVTVDLRQTLLDVAAECHHAATLRSQACHVDVPDEPVHVAGRPEELHSMLANLAGNAIKYSHDGDRIDVRLTVAADEVQVSFTDTGIGIAEVDKPHLFREFFRSTNPDALRRPGTGLGLAIVDRIVKRHSGRVELDSRLGHGTTATVTLPVHRAGEGVSAE